jgi:hypothetical protein
MTDPTMTIRPASAHDAAAVRRLAALDSAVPLSGPVLLAELDGDPVAAVSVDTGSVTADPFQHTAHAVRVLLLRRNQLISDAAGVAPARPLLRRVALDPAR